MDIITLEDIKESNHIKKETCKSCKEQLKGVLSDEQLKQFENAFLSAVKGYTFRRQEGSGK